MISGLLIGWFCSCNFLNTGTHFKATQFEVNNIGQTVKMEMLYVFDSSFKCGSQRHFIAFKLSAKSNARILESGCVPGQIFYTAGSEKCTVLAKLYLY